MQMLVSAASLPLLLLLLLLLLPLTAFCGVLEFAVDEEQPIGTLVGNVKTSHYDVYSIPTEGKKFHLFQKSQPRGLFRVNEDTGDITVKRRIDREQLCGAENPPKCQIDFSIYQDDIGAKVRVIITINDINDCVPAWIVPGNTIRLEFRDGDTPGKYKDLQTAEDGDLGRNASIRYTLKNLGAPFTLLHIREDNRLYVEASKIVDREERDVYNMTLVAVDEGNPQLTGWVRLLISIIDVNDHSPQFTSTVFTPSHPIYEDEPVSSEVLKLNATDKDTGAYGKVYFDFAATTGDEQELARQYFSVQPDGRVLVRQKLDYDRMEKKYFYFEVIARDDARDAEYRRSATATVSVSVRDRIDEAPTIETCFLPSGCLPEQMTPRVKEGLPLKTKVAEVIVRDLDSHDFVHCATSTSTMLSQASEPLPFALESSPDGTGLTYTHTWAFDLVTNRVFDRENEPRVCFAVACNDSAGLRNSGDYCVDVEDVNDSAPVASGPIVLKAPEEDTEMRPLVGHLRDWVHDADEGANGQLRFRLDSTDREAGGQFSIDSVSGQLTPKIVFDREVRDAYGIRVVVQDLGQPPLSSTLSVTVHVVDTNDRQPTFGRPEYVFDVPENSVQFRLVGRVEATDEDLRQNGNGHVTYRLAKLGNSEPLATDWMAFSIDRVTGEITTITKLDREAKSHYAFLVLAEDQPKDVRQKLTGTCHVTVTVTDENDNQPTFKSVPPVFHVRHREPGHYIGQVRAEDSDTGSNGRVEYQLVNGRDINYRFSVDNTSGSVLINQSLRDLTAREFPLELRACDHGQPRRCSEVAHVKAVLVDPADAGGRGDIGDGGGAIADATNSFEPPRNGNGGVGGGRVGGGGGGGGGTYGIGNSETVIACLAAMLLLLGAAVVAIVCVLVRRRSFFITGCKRAPSAVAEATEANALALTVCADATSPAAAQLELDSAASVKMIASPYERYGLAGNYRDCCSREEDFGTYNSSLQLKPTAAKYRRRSAVDRDGRIYGTSPCQGLVHTESARLGTQSEYQPLEPRPRYPWRQSNEAPDRLYASSLNAYYYEIKGGAGDTRTLPRNFRRSNANAGASQSNVAGGAPTAAAAGAGLYANAGKAGNTPSQFKVPRRAPLTPYTEASFV